MYAYGIFSERGFAMTPYGKYQIKTKNDFGNEPYWIDGFPVSSGYIVVLNDCNVMPGATWFQTVKDAKRACDILDSVKNDSTAFWSRLKLINSICDTLAKGVLR
jgi:hypothetical protein